MCEILVKVVIARTNIANEEIWGPVSRVIAEGGRQSIQRIKLGEGHERRRSSALVLEEEIDLTVRPCVGGLSDKDIGLPIIIEVLHGSGPCRPRSVTRLKGARG